MKLYLEITYNTFREDLIVQHHSKTEKENGLNNHGQEVSTKIIPFEYVSLVINSCFIKKQNK